jgi:hypothetical protein
MAIIGLGTLTAELGIAGTGVNKAVRGVVSTAEGEVEAYVKRLKDPRELLVECLCAVLGTRLGLPIPNPILVWIPAELGGPALAFGSTSTGAPDLSTFLSSDAKAVADKLRAWTQLDASACFDEWIGNCDRHQRNLLFDGVNRFWLIDHGLAIHQSESPSNPIGGNQLFDFAIAGKSEAELLDLRSRVLSLAGAYESADLAIVNSMLVEGVWQPDIRSGAIDWLARRQNHLARLAALRIPAKQGNLLGGGGGG